MFPSVRLAALSEHHHIFIMTHDSIGLGEDGPTHQPIEALTMCRATPGLLTLRPADGNETVGSYQVALNHKGPAVLALTRQNVPHLPNSSPQSVALGAYVVHEEPEPTAAASEKKTSDVILIATGSEVIIAINTAKKLLAATPSIRSRVVSMPSWELFDRQPVKYRHEILPVGVPVFSIEALATTGWNRYAHVAIGMTTFGASAPYEAVYEHFGFTPAKLCQRVQDTLKAMQSQQQQFKLSHAASPLPIHLDVAQVPALHSPTPS
jgi:transketolase